MERHAEECIKYFKWLILDDLKDCVCWVAGGAIRDFFSIGHLSSDIDLYFPDQGNYEKAKNVFLMNKAQLVFENEKISSWIYKKHRYELIKIYFPTPYDTICHFDFTVCCGAVDFRDVYLHKDFFMDLAKRRLVINALPYPLSTLQRLQKYIQKGYWICNGGLMDIARAIQSLDLQNPNINTFEFYPDGKPKFIRFD